MDPVKVCPNGSFVLSPRHGQVSLGGFFYRFFASRAPKPLAKASIPFIGEFMFTQAGAIPLDKASKPLRKQISDMNEESSLLHVPVKQEQGLQCSYGIRMANGGLEFVFRAHGIETTSHEMLMRACNRKR